jgi:hypothetical protein
MEGLFSKSFVGDERRENGKKHSARRFHATAQRRGEITIIEKFFHVAALRRRVNNYPSREVKA